MQFDPELAEELGVDCAIMYSNIDFWVEVNRRNKINEHLGRYWTFNTVKAFVELFPFWTEQNIKTILKKLIKAGYLEKGCFNKKGYDKTNWYTTHPSMTDSNLEEAQLELTKPQLESTNPLVRTNQPIPDNKPDSKQQITTDVETKDLSVGQLPPNRGKTHILRVLSIYNDLFQATYGFAPQVPFGRFGKALNTLLQTKTELQISALLVCFFNWAGMSGNDNFEREKLIKSSHNPFWFFSTVNSYEAYLRNVYGLNFDDNSKVREFVALSMSSLK